MYNGLKERSENIKTLLKELTDNTDKYRRKLDLDRHDMISEFLDSKYANDSIIRSAKEHYTYSMVARSYLKGI